VYFGLSDGVDDLPASSLPVKMIRSRLKENWPVFILTNADDASIKGSLSKIADFIIDSSQCNVLNNNYQTGIKLCPVHLLHE
jgi:hypothetical protein